MKKGWIILGSCLFFILGCKDSEKEKPVKEPVEVCGIDCEQADMSEYGDVLEKNHQFLKSSYKQTNGFYGNKDFSGIIYYGRVSCAWCVEVAPILNEAAAEYDLNIYYVDKSSKENAEDKENEQKAIAILDEAYGLEVNDEDKKTLFVPEVVVVKEGEIVGHHLGTVEKHDAHEREMNDDEKRLLLSIYENLIRNNLK